MQPVESFGLFSFMLSAGCVLAGTAPAGRSLSPRSCAVKKRAECGPDIGSCNPGSCCSEAGLCGTSPDYCEGSSCQIDYSDSCDTFFGPPGTSTESVPRPKIGNVPYGTVIKACTVPGTMALTFDDGPYTYTSQILDILDDLDVKATFFITGNNLNKGHIDNASLPWPDLLRRMYSSGHQLASHTWTHRNLEMVNSSIQRTEMIYNEMAFRNLFGWFPAYMRPPYLDCSPVSGCLDLQDSLGYHVVNTNLDTKDYVFDDPEQIQEAKDRFSTMVSSSPADHGYIVLSHDVHYQTVVNLTAFMVSTCRDRGYKLVTVGECLGDPQENWYRSASDDGPHPPIATTSRAAPSTTSGDSSPTSGLKISPDQTCGGDTGYTCQGSAFGNCCAYYQFCGSTDVYCGTGCDPNSGTCNPQSGEVMDTTNGRCGVEFNATCANYGEFKCCSANGYCGNSDEECGAGCQQGYGDCK